MSEKISPAQSIVNALLCGPKREIADLQQQLATVTAERDADLETVREEWLKMLQLAVNQRDKAEIERDELRQQVERMENGIEDWVGCNKGFGLRCSDKCRYLGLCKLAHTKPELAELRRGEETA